MYLITQNKYCSFLILIIATLSIFMISIDMAIVGSSIPTISKDLHLSPDQAANILLAYYLALSSTIILFGKLSDVLGVMNIMIWGCSLFIFGTFAAGMAPNFTLLIGARFIQGLGGAILLPVHATLISKFFTCRYSGKFFGIITFFTGAGYALGYILGGILCRYLSWRWIFFVNIPLGIITLTCIDSLPKGFTNNKDVNLNKHIDYLSALITIVALALLTYLLQQLQNLELGIQLTLSAIIITLLWLLILRIKKYHTPLLPIKMLQNYRLMLPIIIAILVNIIFDGFSFINPFYLSFAKGLTPENSGFMLALLPLSSMLVGPFAGHGCDKFGAYSTAIISAILLIIATIMFYFLEPSSSINYIAAALIIFGISIAIFFTANIKLTMDHATDNEKGMVSAFKACTSYFGGVIGFAIFAQILAGFSNAKILTKIPPNVLINNFKNSCLLGIFLAIIVLLLSLKQKTLNKA
jgi:MFS family permease